MTLEDSVRILGHLERLPIQSQHMGILVKLLRETAIDSGQKAFDQIACLVEACQSRHLKRLECEMHLISVCFTLALRGIDPATPSEQNDHLSLARELCQTYPDTAGLLAPIFERIHQSVQNERNSVKTYYARRFKDLFWSWPAHKIGTLQRCENGHVYSRQTWPECPECGRYVLRQEDAPPTELHDQDFVTAMQSMTTSFDVSAYRS